MKKLLSVILALAVMTALALPVFAADDITPTGGSASQDVTAKFVAPSGESAGTVYKVTLAWEPTADSDLTYTGQHRVYKWDPDTLKYGVDDSSEENTEAAWSGKAGYTLTVTNFSNAGVDVTTEAQNPYELTLTGPNGQPQALGSAAVTEAGDIAFDDTETQGTAQTAKFEYCYEAVSSALPLPANSAAQATVGTITVTVTGK